MFHDVLGHEGQKALLEAAIHADRVAHAYLFHGDEAIGKRLMAIRFAQALNCEQREDATRGCGTCRSCVQTEAGTHPDVLLIEPDRELANPQIKIEQIRQIEQAIMYRPLIGDVKVILIDEADRLTLGAANALLKTLEEPPAHSVFVLITGRPFALPGTIKSRCQCLRFVAPARNQVEAALILKRNMPPRDARLLALICQGRLGQALQSDVQTVRNTNDEFRHILTPKILTSVTALLGIADSLSKAGRIPEALEWISHWLRDLLLVAVGAEPDLLLNTDSIDDLRKMAGTVRPQALLDVLAEIEGVNRSANRNVNLQLALESVLLHLRDVLLPAPSAASR